MHADPHSPVDRRCDVGLMDLLVGRSECGSSGSEALIAAVQSALPGAKTRQHDGA